MDSKEIIPLGKKYSEFQYRVIAESDEVYYRMRKLEDFVKGSIFENLEPIDKNLLLYQLEYMKSYHAVLEWRIKRF